MNEVYLSSGSFISKLNGRDHTLLPRLADRFNCDGFEFMMYSEYYDKLKTVISDVSSVYTPVFHADKAIGDCLSSYSPLELQKGLELLKVNLDTACRLGAKTAVVHCWGLPDSDKDFDKLSDYIGVLYEYSRSSGVDMLVENCVCVYGSPLKHLEQLATRYEGMGLIVDVRCAQFHGEVENTMNSFIWKNNVRHVHISDFCGECRDWSKLRPILSPGKGRIAWDAVIKGIKSNGYAGTFTLESPTLGNDYSVSPEIANEGLEYIRNNLILNK